MINAALTDGNTGDQEMLPLLHDFVDATKDMQHRDTPSGGYRTGGLGEGMGDAYCFRLLLTVPHDSQV